MAYAPQQFSSPQVPYNPSPFAFQPQSSWGGMDYYRAHALSSETGSLYEDAWGRVRDRSSITGGHGIGMDEARRLHRRAYCNPLEVNHMLPEEIGHAAAFQAYRTWLQNGSMYEVLGDTERQREGLVGIAVAEVTRLLQQSAHHLDSYTRSIAAGAAAHTVTRLFYQDRDDYPRGRMRAGSYSGSFVSDSIDDTWSRPLIPDGRSRSRSRSRYRHQRYSSSPSPHRHRHRSRSRAYDDYPTVGAMPGALSYTPSHTGYATSLNEPYSGWPVSISPSNHSMPIYPSTYPTQPLAASYPVQQVPMNMSTPYQTSPFYATSQSSVPYAGSSYPGSYTVPTQGSTVVILGSKKKHRHHRHK